MPLCGIPWLTRWERRIKMDASHSRGASACFFFVAAFRRRLLSTVPRSRRRKRLGCCTEFVVPLMRPVAPQQRASRHWYGTSAETGVETALWNGLTDSDDEEEGAGADRIQSQCFKAPANTENLVALHCLSFVLV